ncbi:phosphoglycerol transferase MdoB-like AlkP superfamily enzyme [Kibdelosporangium banguiense]|uniref:Phosphoglycerol transferase MdoB-like AlkP superfamily enzyme n=1 Tax=Kibdelosporangium banguiense TaxID=1365924 RepID=A0ABS4TF69_9PSEU|nr:hypothetical protein [Kibdelosporangium banguiense]MBP2322481.1 phosphoglycerol transferase MdoB-like AlkP superfamily enzyme [Kibdelosporangium banguiense]
MNTRRLIGACLALLASVLLALSLVFPLYVSRIDSPIVATTMTLTAWGIKSGDGSAGTLFGLGPVHGFPLLFATIVLVVASVLAFAGARTGAAQTGVRTAWIWLTIAAAFVVGVAVTVVPQVTSSFLTMGLGRPGGALDSYFGLGFWSLVVGAVFAVAGAVLAGVPVRKPADTGPQAA